MLKLILRTLIEVKSLFTITLFYKLVLNLFLKEILEVGTKKLYSKNPTLYNKVECFSKKGASRASFLYRIASVAPPNKLQITLIIDAMHPAPYGIQGLTIVDEKFRC